MYWTAAGFVAFLVGCGQPDPVKLGAAASAELPATEAVRAWNSQRWTPVVAGSSAVLVHQIEQGLDLDVVLLAHPKWADALGDRVLARADLLSNEVVLIAEHTGPSLDDLAGADCVAMGDPSHVPGGLYAKSALEREGLWPLVEPRMRATLDAPAAVWAVRRGVCAVGAVYRTDALGIGEVQVGARLEPAEPVRYPLVLLSEEGRPLYDWLRSEPAWPYFEKWGFSRP